MTAWELLLLQTTGVWGEEFVVALCQPGSYLGRVLHPHFSVHFNNGIASSLLNKIHSESGAEKSFMSCFTSV